jgi:hypothetical protein
VSVVRFRPWAQKVEEISGPWTPVQGPFFLPAVFTGNPGSFLHRAGKRLLERDTFGREKYGMVVISAREAGVSRRLPTGGPALHCYLGHQTGDDPASVAAFLSHKSPSTLRHFYATHAVPAKVPTLAWFLRRATDLNLQSSLLQAPPMASRRHARRQLGTRRHRHLGKQ